MHPCTLPFGLAALRAGSFKFAPDKFVEPCRALRDRVRPSLFVGYQKAPQKVGPFGIWRRGRDSNPRYGSTPYTHFPGEPVQPLRHLSKTWSEFFTSTAQSVGIIRYILYLTLRARRASPGLIQNCSRQFCRTLGTAQHRTLTFQASPFNHSGTSPATGTLILTANQGRQL